MRSVYFASVILCVANVTCAQDWREVVSEECNFRVMMPNPLPPQQTPDQLGRVTRVFTGVADGGETIYSVNMVKFDLAPGPAEFSKAMDLADDDAFKGTNGVGKMTTTEATISGAKGRANDWQGSLSGRKAYFSRRSLLAGDQLYQLLVMRFQMAPEARTARDFFESFSLIRQDGKPTKDDSAPAPKLSNNTLEPDWQEFVSEDLNVRVMLPRLPENTRTTGVRLSVMVMSHDDLTTFSISRSRGSTSNDPRLIAMQLDAGAQAAFQVYGGKAFTTTDFVAKCGLTGRQYEFTGQFLADKMYIVRQAFMVGDQVYDMTVMRKASPVDDETRDKFFGSFDLVKTPRGVKVRTREAQPEKEAERPKRPPRPRASDKGETSKPASEIRKWTSADGKFSVEAAFVSKAGDKIKLRRQDGKEITVSAEKLSAEDLKYLEDRAK